MKSKGAVEFARQCISEKRRISPKVEAVVVRDGVMLGGAFRGELVPGNHAEFTLLETKLRNETLAGAILFTTWSRARRGTAPRFLRR